MHIRVMACRLLLPASRMFMHTLSPPRRRHPAASNQHGLQSRGKGQHQRGQQLSHSAAVAGPQDTFSPTRLPLHLQRWHTQVLGANKSHSLLVAAGATHCTRRGLPVMKAVAACGGGRRSSSGVQCGRSTTCVQSRPSASRLKPCRLQSGWRGKQGVCCGRRKQRRHSGPRSGVAAAQACHLVWLAVQCCSAEPAGAPRHPSQASRLHAAARSTTRQMLHVHRSPASKAQLLACLMHCSTAGAADGLFIVALLALTGRHAMQAQWHAHLACFIKRREAGLALGAGARALDPAWGGGILGARAAVVGQAAGRRIDALQGSSARFGGGQLPWLRAAHFKAPARVPHLSATAVERAAQARRTHCTGARSPAAGGLVSGALDWHRVLALPRRCGCQGAWQALCFAALPLLDAPMRTACNASWGLPAHRRAHPSCQGVASTTPSTYTHARHKICTLDARLPGGLALQLGSNAWKGAQA